MEASAQNCVASVCVPIGASSSVAVSSVTVARKTSAAAAPSPGRICGSVTRTSARSGPQPSERASSSCTGGACASAARVATSASGSERIA